MVINQGGTKIPPINILTTMNTKEQEQIYLNQQRVYDFLNKYQGIATRLKTIFAAHYDQIQREVTLELFNCQEPDKDLVMGFIVEHMEEIMNWPDPENQTLFNQQIANI